MVSKQTIKVLIEAEEKVSKVAQKAEKALDKLGNVGKKGMEGINSASSKLHSGMSKLSSFVDRARNKFNELKNSGSNAGSAIKNAIGNASSIFGKLTTSANSAKLSMEKIKSVSDGIQSKLSNLTSKISEFGNTARTKLTQAFSMGNIKAKLNSVGTSIDKLKAKMKELTTQSKASGGGLGFLKSAASMTVGMIGYDLVNAFVESGRAAINANSQLQYFGKRLKMSGSETKNFESSLENMQKSFQKVNMKAVGASAEEMAVKLKLPKSSLEELTKTTAVMSSAFVKEGRTQEDAILAVSDAMDGQFRRLQELGISQDQLKNNGWDGDIENKDSLLKAMNKTLDSMGFTETAQDITNLDEAYQALTVNGGILLEKVLVPLTPLLINIMKAVGGAMNAIGGFIQMAQSAFGSLPEWAQLGLAIGAIAVAVGLAIAYFGGLEAILLGLAGAIAPVIGAITAISAPIVAVVAAIGLVIAAIYEVGKAFGWWKDAGTMLEAIWAGLNRLWSAFINHPDVQASISAITGALSWLAGAIGNAFNEILKFFGVSTSSNWDIVSSIINGIGIAWQVMSGHIRLAVAILQGAWGVLSWLVGSAVGIGQAIYNALKPIVCILLGCSPGIVPALKTVAQVFTSVWNGIASFVGGIISTVVTAIQPLLDILSMIGEFIVGQFMESWNAFVSIIMIVWNSVSSLIAIFQGFMSGQIGLVDALTMVWNTIGTMFATIMNIIVQRVISFGASLGTLAINIATRFVTGIITYISQLPGKVYSFLMNARARILVALNVWVLTAKTKAQNMVTGIITFLKTLPGKAYSALMNVVARIKSAIQSWINAAKSKVQSLITSIVKPIQGIPNKISSALAGVANAFTKPFRDAWNFIKPYYDKIKNALDIIPNFSAGEGVDSYGNIYENGVLVGNVNDTKTTSTVSSEPTISEPINGSIDLNHELKLTFNFENVPDNINEQHLIQALKSKEVLKAITSNPEFQSLDSKMKSVINAKSRRARGA